MTTGISSERKTLYYVGMLLIVGGLLLFVSNFFLIGGDHPLPGEPSPMSGMVFRAIGGMGLMLVGSIMRHIGARGLAGSGAVLDPDGARRDLAPFSRQAGGMLKDALDAADLRTGGSSRVVMVKCGSCGKLNEEDSKFCQECGKPV